MQNGELWSDNFLLAEMRGYFPALAWLTNLIKTCAPLRSTAHPPEVRTSGGCLDNLIYYQRLLLYLGHSNMCSAPCSNIHQNMYLLLTCFFFMDAGFNTGCVACTSLYQPQSHKDFITMTEHHGLKVTDTDKYNSHHQYLTHE